MTWRKPFVTWRNFRNRFFNLKSKYYFLEILFISTPFVTFGGIISALSLILSTFLFIFRHVTFFNNTSKRNSCFYIFIKLFDGFINIAGFCQFKVERTKNVCFLEFMMGYLYYNENYFSAKNKTYLLIIILAVPCIIKQAAFPCWVNCKWNCI